MPSGYRGNGLNPGIQGGRRAGFREKQIWLSPQNFKPQWAMEIKWTNRFLEKPEEIKSLLTFCENNKLKSALVTTIDKSGSMEKNKIRIHYLPDALYAYTVGRNTILQKQNRNG